MSRRRRTNWKRLTAAVIVVAGVSATVAIAQTGVGGAMGFGGIGAVSNADSIAGQAPPDLRLQEEQTRTVQAQTCTRFASLTLAASQGIRQGRVEQAADGRMIVIGRLKGSAVRMTLETGGDACRVVRIEAL